MRLDDLSGDISVNPAHAASMIKSLFLPTDIVAVSSKRARKVSGKNVLTQRVYASELVSGLLGDGGEELLYSLCTQPDHMDTYFALAPVKTLETESISIRVKKEDVAHIGLLYADLDVKPGSFTSQQEALNFLGSLPYKPNCVVSSGSGGLHAYWKVEGFAGPGTINPHLGEDLLIHWWAYLSESALGRNIDRLVDVARMSRLAGTIRWPKPNEEIVPRPVELLYANPVGFIPAVDLLKLTDQAWKNLQEKRKQVRKRDESIQVDASVAASALGGGKWSQLLAVSEIEDWVALMLPWDNILEPAGWTYLREDGDGRREWQRPGGDGKSAVTDWPDSPDVMSLLSTSVETLLDDLHDAEIPLTKWRCMLRLNFSDDVNAAVSWVLGQMGLTG